ncbi:amino acid ABC transporter substrate-binding protein, PAAT family [Arboricoccus pini]|uniref:Amino acid ABC transporter substrate-binding protein, PAAT family n=1 Tax=Arboricoccus pini TaxID=1963835 RepID=A0A212RV42_9PROT|nr:ABC transporter substrate-binding protein [Arboricoccus pini]SNB76510.1 amino acid ABC transporter substrate-binding protein, PAAT family [Arboricoccus pini]
MNSRCRGWLAAALLVSLCPPVADAASLPAEIASSKTLRLALEPSYPPLEMRDTKTNELTGFDVELATAIASDLGLKIEWQTSAFEQLTPSLQSGRADMIMSGFYDIPKRRGMFDFVDYLKAGAQFYTLAASKELKTVSDLCGKTVTTTRGTSFPETIKALSDKSCAGKEPITVIVDTDLGQQLSNLKQGRADAAVQGLEAVPTIVAQDPGMYRPMGEPFSSTLMGMAFSKDNPGLRDAFQEGLKKVIADGRYDALIAKWKLDLSSYKEATVNLGPAP